MHLCNARRTGEVPRRLFIIACDEGCADTQRMQATHGLCGIGPQRVPERYETQQHAVPSDADHGESAHFEFGDPSALSTEVRAFGREKRWAAHRKLVTFETGPDASTCDRLESFHLRQRDPAAECLFHDRARKRMFR